MMINSQIANNQKPIIIFRFIAHEGAGFFCEFLTAQKIKWQLHEIDEGRPPPASILAYSGMVLMGGPMSANDDLPWIVPIFNLIREAHSSDIPLLGHCLGGQLISKALGGEITKNTINEIGWGEVTLGQNEIAKNWFGDIETFNSFHWHGETFSLPPNAVRLLSSQFCQNQAWAMGKHLALQCHIEMTAEMVQNWCVKGEAELKESASSQAVQQTNEMTQDLMQRCQTLNKVATHVYTQWIAGLKP